MRARLLGAVLAFAAAPAAFAAPRTPAGGVACAAPTDIHCKLLVPDFTRYFEAPFGVAPSDRKMAAELCGPGFRPDASTVRRRPKGTGLVNNDMTVLDVVCGPAARRAPVPKAPLRPPAEPARTGAPIAGSPQDFEPEFENRRPPAGAAGARRVRRVERRRQLNEARRDDARPPVGKSKTIERDEPRKSETGRRTAPEVFVPRVAPKHDAPANEPVPPSRVDAADPAAAAKSPRPSAADVQPRPKRAPKPDPSISYEHF
jgi:hypothetical protein